MKEEVRIGIVGCGNMGFSHAKHIAEGLVPSLRLTALCDSSPEKQAEMRRRFPDIPCFHDDTALLKSGLCDAILIAVPHYLHPTIAIDAFRAGLHVLTEKPAGVYGKQVLEMNRAAEEAGTVFGIMYNQRTTPIFRKAREMVQSGELGEVTRSVWMITNWFRSDAYYRSGSWRATWKGEGGGVLMNQAPHNLDLWQWIIGMPTRLYAVCTEGKHHAIEVEDDVTVLTEYPNGATGLFVTSTGEYPGTNRLEIAGTRGKLVLEQGSLKWWKLGEDVREICRTCPENFPHPAVEYTEEKPGNELEGHIAILRNFTDAVLGKAELIAPGKEGISEVTLANAAYLSSWEGKWVSLPIDYEDYYRRLMERRARETNGKAAVLAESEAGSNAGSGEYSERWQVRW